MEGIGGPDWRSPVKNPMEGHIGVSCGDDLGPLGPIGAQKRPRCRSGGLFGAQEGSE